MKKASKTEKLTAYILLCIMIVSLLPVMYLGRYNHPTGDDYYYGAETKIVWEETGSVLKTVEEAARGAAYQYGIWQGTYSAMFLMYLPPNLFGEGAYHLVTPVILMLLVGGIFYLMKPIVCGLLKGTTNLWLIISSLLTLLCVQTVPSQGESFFWYNGSMYYTGFYAMTLFFLGLALRYMAAPKRRYIFLMSVLALFLAGGNYVSLLPALLIVCMLTAFLLWKHLPGARGMAVVGLLLLAGFFINILAPGNQVRKDGMWSIPAWKAILKSLLQGIRYACSWTGIWVALALLIATPFLWKTVSQINFRFPYPVLVIGFAYGVFCSMSCPTFYTMNSTGPARVVAIVYYAFLFFLFLSYFYLLGYVCQVIKRRQRLSVFFQTMANSFAVKGAVMALFCLLAAVQILSGKVTQSTSGKAIRLLASGEAAAYEREYQERLRILEDDTVKDVVFQPYVSQPEMLYVGDFVGDAQDVTNQKVAKYFHKYTVCVEY